MADHALQEVQVIESSLNKNPIHITIEIWDMLRKYDLCRTASK